MAITVIDGLEAIQIEENGAKRGLCPLRAGNLPLRMADEPAPVPDLGQWVGLCRSCQIVQRQIQLLEGLLNLIEHIARFIGEPAGQGGQMLVLSIVSESLGYDANRGQHPMDEKESDRCAGKRCQ